MFEHSKAFSGFSVDSIEKAKKFYGETLGLETKDNPMGLLELDLIGGSKIIIYPKPDHKPAEFTILNFPVTDIDKAVNDLKSKGVKFETYEGQIETDENNISRGKPQVAWFRDPAGNILSVIQSIDE